MADSGCSALCSAISPCLVLGARWRTPPAGARGGIAGLALRARSLDRGRRAETRSKTKVLRRDGLHSPSALYSRLLRKRIKFAGRAKSSVVERAQPRLNRVVGLLLLVEPALALQLTVTGRLFELQQKLTKARYLVDPASSHMLVSKIKPCMSKYKPH